ncbi:unnamed protein product, partial [Rotaria socialis]
NPRGGYNNNRGASNNNPNNNRKCYTCGDYGHLANSCPSRQQNAMQYLWGFRRKFPRLATMPKGSTRDCKPIQYSGSDK